MRMSLLQLALGSILAFSPVLALGQGIQTGGGPPMPSVDSVTPKRGPVEGGTTVTILGDYFPQSARVSFGGVEAQQVVVVNPGRITAVTPPHHAGRVAVAVGGGVRGWAFTYEKERKE